MQAKCQLLKNTIWKFKTEYLKAAAKNRKHYRISLELQFKKLKSSVIRKRYNDYKNNLKQFMITWPVA